MHPNAFKGSLVIRVGAPDFFFYYFFIWDIAVVDRPFGCMWTEKSKSYLKFRNNPVEVSIFSNISAVQLFLKSKWFQLSLWVWTVCVPVCAHLHTLSSICLLTHKHRTHRFVCSVFDRPTVQCAWQLVTRLTFWWYAADWPFWPWKNMFTSVDLNCMGMFLKIPNVQYRHTMYS